MSANKSIPLVVALVSLSFVAVAFADGGGQRGKIRICRISIPGESHDPVYVPADGTYSGGCDSTGEHCRNITVGVTEAGHLKGGAGACLTLDAVLKQGDGSPVNAGQTLIPQWDTGTLESKVSVVKSFK